MNGQWLYREILNHTCPKPGYVSGGKAGDIWKCDCGKMWRVSKVESVQREGNWFVWEEFVGEVPTQKGYTPPPSVGVTSWRDR